MKKSSLTTCRIILAYAISILFHLFFRATVILKLYRWKKAGNVIKVANRKIASFGREFQIPVAWSYPHFVTLQTTWSCNLRCPMCFRQAIPIDELREMNQRHMSPEVFIKLADMLFPMAQYVNLSNSGEPLMYEHLDLVLDKCAEYGTKLILYTNITRLVDDQLLQKLIPHIGILRASIDGATRETFEQIREGANFDRCISALKRFDALRRRIHPESELEFWITIQNSNVHELPDLITLAHDVGADRVGGLFAVSFDASSDSPEDVDQVVYSEVYSEVCKRADEYQIDISMLTKPDETKASVTRNHPKPIKCPFLWNQIIIDVDGTAWACCHSNPPRYPGNVLNDRFLPVWNNKTTIHFRSNYLNEHAHPSCKSCYIIRRYE